MGTEIRFDIREDIYGQCWSETRESDAMWRIYSPHSTGVKIRTTLEKLHRCLDIEKTNNNLFIGKVEYLTRNELVSRARNRVEMQKTFIGGGIKKIAGTLLFKRREFSHENEVRIIYVEEGSNKQAKKLHKISFDPLELIEQIVFDPRIDKELFEVYKKHLKGIGFGKSIIRSSLYELPKFKSKI